MFSRGSVVSSVIGRGPVLAKPGCLLLSCLIVLIKRHSQGQSNITDENILQKKKIEALLLTMCRRGGVFWSESLMVSNTSQSQGCELQAGK